MATASEGFRTVDGGIVIRIGARQPSLSGMSLSIIARREYIIADDVIDGGAFMLLYVSSPVPVKSKCAEPVSGSIVIFTTTGVPSS